VFIVLLSWGEKVPTSAAQVPTLEEAKEALLRSGYLLESRLDSVLRRYGYYVEANTAYADPETSKSRELDLFALKAFKAGPDEYDFIFLALLIECINNPQPIAFITKEPLVSFLHTSEIKLAGIPAKVLDGKSWVSLADYLDMEKYHHYCKGRIATQFCSFKRKKGEAEWMAWHEEAQFDALQKLCAGIEYLQSVQYKGWRPGSHEDVNIEFYYPLLVVQGELLDARPSGHKVNLRKTNRLQYRRSVFVTAAAEAIDYQIDVVRESSFSRYLGLIEQEATKTARLLRRRQKVVRRSIGAIARQAKRASKARLRSVLESVP
jgi:hypothetical protein